MDLYQWKFGLPRGIFHFQDCLKKSMAFTWFNSTKSAPFQFQCCYRKSTGHPATCEDTALAWILRAKRAEVALTKNEECGDFKSLGPSISEISETLSSATLPSGICPLVQIDNSGQPYTPGCPPDVISYRYMCHSADGCQSRQHLNAWNIVETSLKLDNKPYKSWGIVVVYSINSSPQLFGEISANSITKKSSLWLSGSSWAVTTSRTWLHLQGKSVTNKWLFHPLGFTLHILAEIKSRILGGQGKTVIFSNFCQGKFWVFFLDVWNFRPEESERILQTSKLLNGSKSIRIYIP